MRLPRKKWPTKEDAPPLDVNRFRIAIPEAGYCWVQDAKPSEMAGNDNKLKLGLAPYMAVNITRQYEQFPARDYFPLAETPDLFLRFRNVALTPDAILGFANKHGWIAETGFVEYGDQGLSPAIGIGTWYAEIQAMIVAHHLWDCITKNDRRELRKYFTWDSHNFNVRLEIGIDRRQVLDKTDLDVKRPQIRWSEPLRRPYTQWLVRPADVDPLRDVGWSQGDVIGPARLAMMTFINSRLETLCRPRLYLDKTRGFAGHLTPVNLLGCIWLQFYLSIIGQLKLRRCEVCGFEMDVTESRTTRRMHSACSKRKRMQKWRLDRKSRAEASTKAKSSTGDLRPSPGFGQGEKI